MADKNHITDVAQSSQVTDTMVEAAAREMWNDRDARMGGPWEGRSPNEVCVIQTKATARAALVAALAAQPPAAPVETDNDRLRCRQKLEAEYNDLIYLHDTGADSIPLEKAMDIAELGLSFIDATSPPRSSADSKHDEHHTGEHYA